MDKLTQAFLQQVQVLQDSLSKLLEKPEEPKKATGPKFEVTTDLSGLSQMIGHLQGKSSDQAARTAFQFLTPYFESGVLMQYQNQTAKPQMAFRSGDIHPLLPQDLELNWNIPEFNFSEIKILISPKLKDDFAKLGFLDPETEVLIAFRFLPEYLVLLVSKLPDVFLQHHVTRIQSELMKYFAEIET